MATSRKPSPRPRRHDPADDDHAALLAAVNTAEQLLPLLGRLLPEPSSGGPATGTIGRHAPESSEPWQSEAANAYWGIYFGSRKLADRLRYAAGLPQREWGAGDTSKALSLIIGLAGKVDPHSLAEARTVAESWVSQARRIRDIDQVDAWVPVPRVAGSIPPACPYCHTLSLRMSRLREEVRCFFPNCRDLDGRPTRARMERSFLADGGQLVFGDGTVVAYREVQSTTGGAHGPLDTAGPAGHP